MLGKCKHSIQYLHLQLRSEKVVAQHDVGFEELNTEPVSHRILQPALVQEDQIEVVALAEAAVVVVQDWKVVVAQSVGYQVPVELLVESRELVLALPLVLL